jgi:hypothetical protein
MERQRIISPVLVEQGCSLQESRHAQKPGSCSLVIHDGLGA